MAPFAQGRLILANDFTLPSPTPLPWHSLVVTRKFSIVKRCHEGTSLPNLQKCSLPCRQAIKINALKTFCTCRPKAPNENAQKYHFYGLWDSHDRNGEAVIKVISSEDSSAWPRQAFTQGCVRVCVLLFSLSSPSDTPSHPLPFMPLPCCHFALRLAYQQWPSTPRAPNSTFYDNGRVCLLWWNYHWSKKETRQQSVVTSPLSLYF